MNLHPDPQTPDSVTDPQTMCQEMTTGLGQDSTHRFLFMPKIIEAPARIEAHGQPPKVIEEFVGRVNSRLKR